jgi:hypothetical protein
MGFETSSRETESALQTPTMKKILIAACLSAAACSGTDTAGIKPDSSGAKVPSERQASLVRIVETTPENPGRTGNLSVSICPERGSVRPVSRDDVLLKLKTRALMNGFTALYDVNVGPVTGSLERECPRGLRAQGTGFYLPV